MSLKSQINYLYKRARLSLHYRTIYAYGMDSVYRCYQNFRIRQIRKKQKIRVLFIVGEASMWKSEILYQKMLKHPRFEPIIAITESLFVPGSKGILVDYLNSQGYPYIDLDDGVNTISSINPDIKFYYKPYENNYHRGIYFDYNLKSLVCNINYAFNQGGDKIAYKHEIRRYSWIEFIENETVLLAIRNVGKYYKNKAITGVPLQDYLSLPKDIYQDPWLDRSGKKRIIYAPHHSLKGTNGDYIEYSTFLDFGDIILEMAQKYADSTEWIFKPHPSLETRLIEKWGKERTEAYYKAWENLSNAQLKLGSYNDIFKYSDAMIHDCSSFIIEYQYTGNPVLYLEYETKTPEQMHQCAFGYDAYKVHYHASNREQVELFVQNVINGVDPRKHEREAYFEKYLKIPNGKTACDNIINTILGN